MANYFRLGNDGIDNVMFGIGQVNKVYIGTELLFEFVAGVTFSPIWDSDGGYAPFTSAEYDVVTPGTFYANCYNAGDYIEVYWYKNGSIQNGGNPLWVYDGGDIYPSGQTFTVAAGDKVKFMLNGPMQQAVVDLHQESESGSLVFHGEYFI